MSKEKTKETILKLRRHAESARSLGSNLEADAYNAQIKKLKRKYGLTEKDLKETTENNPNSVSGKWICSCGMSLTLDVSAGKASLSIAEMMLAPHRSPSHRLTKVE